MAEARGREADALPPHLASRNFDEDRDATRRTRLANERTYLAWWRSGLTALTVSIAVGKVVPVVASASAHWPWAVLGLLYGILGIAFIAYGFVRHRTVEEAIQRFEFAPPDERLVAAITAYGLLVALGTIAIVALEL